jgi:hypothetical protein
MFGADTLRLAVFESLPWLRSRIGKLDIQHTARSQPFQAGPENVKNNIKCQKYKYRCLQKVFLLKMPIFIFYMAIHCRKMTIYGLAGVAWYAYRTEMLTSVIKSTIKFISVESLMNHFR